MPANNNSAHEVVDLRAEHTACLLGTQEDHPRLSWRIEGATAGIAQSGYRVRAAATAAALTSDEELLWDSGQVDSRETFDIRYAGPALQSMQRVWWDVEVVDDRGRSARSEPAWMEAGLKSAGDWQAQWLEAEDALAAADRAAGLEWIWGEDPLRPGLHAFRIDFDAPAELADAELMIAGKDNLVAAWVNGKACRLPTPEYWGTIRRIDGEIRAGRNSLCVAVTAETEGFFPPDGGAFAALIRLHRADGSIERIVSNSRWRVAVDPADGWESADADVSQWSTAFKSGSRASGDPRPPEPAILLRREFEAKRSLVGARLYATALGAYEARINGQPVADSILAPEPSVAHEHVLYQCYDVGHLVSAGANAIGFTVADGFYASAFGWRMERYSLGPAPRRLLAQLRLDYDDGTSDWISTGPGWRTSVAPATAADIYGGVTWDARLAQDGWDQPAFDDRGWSDASIGAPPASRLVAHTSPPLRPNLTLRAQSVTQPAPGKFVFDFGQNFAGWARLAAAGPAGTRITLRFAEILLPDGTVDQSNLRRADATDVFILRGAGEAEHFEPRFTYHGFRYVQVEGFPGEPTPDDLKGIVIYSDCRETGKMEFQQALLQKIWNNGLWSQRSNFFAVPTDCPQRDERMGWMGDIQVFLDASAFNMEVDAFTRRFLLEARAGQFENGGYPIVVPVPQSFPEVVTAGWSEAGIILPHGLWQRYGDTAVIDENWDAMVRWMEFVARDNPDDIWRQNRGLDLGDWLSVDAKVPDEETTPRVLCATTYWALCAQMMSAMAAVTGREAAARDYSQLYERIRKAFCQEFVDASGVAGNGSQTSQVLALYTGLVPEDLRPAAARVLAEEIAGRGMKLSTGFLGTPYLLDVLADEGEFDTVEKLLLQTGYPSWGYMATSGATTVWERWNSDVGDIAMNSYNHYALGAVIGFFYRRLAGIAPAAPGFRRISVRPLWLPAVGHVTASYDSIVGRIATRVDGDRDGISSLQLSVPANSEAEIELPARFEWSAEDGRVEEVFATESREQHAGVLHFKAGPGNYHFKR